MIKDTLRTSRKFTKNLNKLISQANDYHNLLDSILDGENSGKGIVVDIEAPYLNALSEIILLFPYVKGTIVKTEDAYEIDYPIIDDIKKMIMDNYNQGTIDKTTKIMDEE